jgi:hypothetical protein
MKKKAKENFESNLDNILLDNSTNPKTYWKIMKMLIKSNKGSNCIPPPIFQLGGYLPCRKDLLKII